MVHTSRLIDEEQAGPCRRWETGVDRIEDVDVGTWGALQGEDATAYPRAMDMFRHGSGGGGAVYGATSVGLTAWPTKCPSFGLRDRPCFRL